MMLDATPDILARIADEAEQMAGMCDGVLWCRSHTLQDVEFGMDSRQAYWVLVNYGDQMSGELQDLFVAAVSRHPISCRKAWNEAIGLTDEHYRRLAAVTAANGVVMSGTPGALHHLSHVRVRQP